MQHLSWCFSSKEPPWMNEWLLCATSLWLKWKVRVTCLSLNNLFHSHILTHTNIGHRTSCWARQISHPQIFYILCKAPLKRTLPVKGFWGPWDNILISLAHKIYSISLTVDGTVDLLFNNHQILSQIFKTHPWHTTRGQPCRYVLNSFSGVFLFILPCVFILFHVLFLPLSCQWLFQWSLLCFYLTV